MKTLYVSQALKGIIPSQADVINILMRKKKKKKVPEKLLHIIEDYVTKLAYRLRQGGSLSPATFNLIGG